MRKLVIEACPFCGGSGSVFADNGGLDIACGCMACGVRSKKYSSVSKAIKAWNKRFDTLHSVLVDVESEIRKDSKQTYSISYSLERHLYVDLYSVPISKKDKAWDKMLNLAHMCLDRGVEMHIQTYTDRETALINAAKARKPRRK